MSDFFTLTLDLNEVEKYINSPEFVTLIMNNVTDLSIAGFILQSVRKNLENLKEGV